MFDKAIRKSKVIPAALKDVWEAWTTSKGAATFFAPQADIQLEIGGRYELYFNPEATEGERGSEGVKVLSFLPMSMLSFSWNAPPEIPAIRGMRTWVVVQLEQVADTTTHVTIHHLGWGVGEDWDRAFAYFMRAWDIVLDRLAQRFEKGPIDWESL